jgi:hypothetical protein
LLQVSCGILGIGGADAGADDRTRGRSDPGRIADTNRSRVPKDFHRADVGRGCGSARLA